MCVWPITCIPLGQQGKHCLAVRLGNGVRHRLDMSSQCKHLLISVNAGQPRCLIIQPHITSAAPQYAQTFMFATRQAANAQHTAGLETQGPIRPASYKQTLLLSCCCDRRHAEGCRAIEGMMRARTCKHPVQKPAQYGASEFPPIASCQVYRILPLPTA